MYLMDFHHHTNHSFDSMAIMEEVCHQAIANGLEEICFTEHFSVNPLAPTYGHMNLTNYQKDIQACQEKFSGQLTIKMGIELCEPHLLIDQYEKALKPIDFDFILGSIHNLNNQKLRLSLKEHQLDAYRLYFEELYKMVSAADIDCLAHFDLMKRYAYKEYGFYVFEEHQEIIRSIIEKAIDRNIGIEINTSGLRNAGLNQTMPSREILKLYRELGGQILTIGSDSHKAETVGAGFHDAIELAKQCGFEYIYHFDKRKPIPVKL
ncbi:histidinol-phosphatase HisJ family protein [Neobacillus sp. K501]